MKVLSSLSILFLSFFLIGSAAFEPWPSNPQTAGEKSPIYITAVGDIMMGSTCPESLLPPEDGKGLFQSVFPFLSDADVVLGNLEGPLADDIRPLKCSRTKSIWCFEFVTPTRYVAHIASARFNVMGIANNHTFDAGHPGMKSTIQTLNFAGVEVSGGKEVATLKAKGRRLAVAGFSYTYSPYSYSILDIPMVKKIVRKLKGENDLLVVSFHGGAEGTDARHVTGENEYFLGEQRGNVMEFARASIDAGADMVIGHGPHVLRAIELYKGKLIAYSLGNFLTYMLFNTRGPNGISVILRVMLDRETGDFISGQLVPIKLLNNGIPEIDESGEGIKTIQVLTSMDIVDSRLDIDENGNISRKDRDMVQNGEETESYFTSSSE